MMGNLALPERGSYTTVPTTPTTPAAMSQDDVSDCNVSIAYEDPARRLRLPSLTRFLGDFTLGFADGLTVPFALTAGLSSLGKTDTVIYAGMAEICAGSISMGIGGYLSARGDAAAAVAAANRAQEENTRDADFDQEKASGSISDATVEDYLMPLSLPQHLLEAVRAHVRDEPTIVQALLDSKNDGSEEPKISPIMSGFSVALGYLLGGLLPLFPYFFVTDIGAGVRWSFIVCIFALFIFGFTKHYLLQEQPKDGPWSQLGDRRARRWDIVKQSLWEGLQMVILGSIAAIAALVCVQAFEGYVS